jgi:preprotein translocase subunit SecB
MDLAATVSQRVEGMQLLLAESTTRRGSVRNRLPAKLEMNVNVETKADKEQSGIGVRLRFTLIAKYAEAAGEELLRIEAAFVLRYRIPSFEGIGDKNIEAFGKLNGLFNAWPYWREFVQSTTVRMGLPALTVPMYRVLDTPKLPKETTRRGRREKSKR